MSARQIVDGKVGDQFIVKKGFKGKWSNAVGVPMDEPRGQQVLLPGGSKNSEPVIVTRPDFRTVSKDSPVFPKNKQERSNNK